MWTLAELPGGNIAVGTLGGGLQMWNCETERLIAVKQQLPSKYIASLSVLKNEWLRAIGHSVGVTLLNLHTSKTINLGTDKRKDGSRQTRRLRKTTNKGKKHNKKGTSLFRNKRDKGVPFVMFKQ